MRGALSQKTAVKRKGDDIAPVKRPTGAAPSSQSVATGSHAAGTSDWKAGSAGGGPEKKSRTSKGQTSHLDMEIESLLNQQSTKEQQNKKVPNVEDRT